MLLRFTFATVRAITTVLIGAVVGYVVVSHLRPDVTPPPVPAIAEASAGVHDAVASVDLAVALFERDLARATPLLQQADEERREAVTTVLDAYVPSETACRSAAGEILSPPERRPTHGERDGRDEDRRNLAIDDFFSRDLDAIEIEISNKFQIIGERLHDNLGFEPDRSPHETIPLFVDAHPRIDAPAVCGLERQQYLDEMRGAFLGRTMMADESPGEAGSVGWTTQTAQVGWQFVRSYSTAALIAGAGAELVLDRRARYQDESNLADELCDTARHEVLQQRRADDTLTLRGLVDEALTEYSRRIRTDVTRALARDAADRVGSRGERGEHSIQ